MSTRSLANRLATELSELGGPHCRLAVKAMPARQHLVWRGGSILASISAFGQMWFTRKEYDERGPSIVHGK